MKTTRVTTVKSAASAATIAITATLGGCGVFHQSAKPDANQSDHTFAITPEETVSVSKTDPASTHKADVAPKQSTGTRIPDAKNTEERTERSIIHAAEVAALENDASISLIGKQSDAQPDVQEASASVTAEVTESKTETASASETIVNTAEKEESSKPIADPLQKENERILKAAAKLSYAIARMDQATKDYRASKEAYESIRQQIKSQQSLLDSPDIVEGSKALLGEKQAILELAKQNQAKADAKLQEARSAYEAMIMDAESSFENAQWSIANDYNEQITQIDRKYQEALADAEAVYDAAIATCNEQYGAAKIAYDTAVERYNALAEAAKTDIEGDYTSALAMAQEEKNASDATAAEKYDAAIAQAEETRRATIAAAQASYDSNLAAAQEAYDTAIANLNSASFQNAVASYQSALEEQQCAVAAETEAKHELESAEARLQELKTQREAAEQTEAAAKQNVSEAKQSVCKAEENLAEARKALIQANGDKETAKQQYEAAAKELAGAQAEKEAAERELESAKQVHADESIDAKITAAEQAVKEAEASLKEAQETINTGAYGFFQHQNNTTACRILDGSYSGRLLSGSGVSYQKLMKDTHIGADRDATSLENMKQAIDLIEEVNVKRDQENTQEHVFNKNLQPYQVSDALMAISMVTANYAQNQFNHPGTFNVSENLAGAGKGYAVDAWYGERDIYWSNLERAEKYKKWGAYTIYKTDPTFYLETGHYLNIVSTDKIIGMGIAGNNGRTAMDTGSTWYVGNEPSYSVDAYRNAFMDYYNAVMSAREAAEADLSQAKQTLASLQNQRDANGIDEEAVKAAEQKVAKAIQNINTANAVLESANLTYSDSVRIYEVATEAVNNAETAVETAKSEVLTAEEAELAAAEKTAAARISEGNVEEQVELAKQVLSDAEAEMAEAAESVTLAEENVSEEQEKLDAQAEAETKNLEEARNSNVVETAQAEADATYQKAVKTAGQTKLAEESFAQAQQVQAEQKAAEDRDAKLAKVDQDVLNQIATETESYNAITAGINEREDNAQAEYAAAKQNAETEKTAAQESAQKVATDKQNTLNAQFDEQKAAIELQAEQATAELREAAATCAEEVTQAKEAVTNAETTVKKAEKLTIDEAESKQKLAEQKRKLEAAERDVTEWNATYQELTGTTTAEQSSLAFENGYAIELSKLPEWLSDAMYATM